MREKAPAKGEECRPSAHPGRDALQAELPKLEIPAPCTAFKDGRKRALDHILDVLAVRATNRARDVLHDGFGVPANEREFLRNGSFCSVLSCNSSAWLCGMRAKHG